MLYNLSYYKADYPAPRTDLSYTPMVNVPPPIRTLIFDLDGTLTIRKPSSLDVFFQLLGEYDYHPTVQARRTTRQFIHYYWAGSPEAARDIKELGKFTASFWENYLIRQCLAFGCSKKEAVRLAAQLAPRWDDAYQPETVIPADVYPTLKTLGQAGYTLGLVSNRSQPFQEEIDQLGLAGYFQFSFTAGEVDSWKPDRKIFLHALERAETAPEKAAYIGDNYYADILGARQVGIHPILIDPHDTFPGADCQVIRVVGDLLTQP